MTENANDLNFDCRRQNKGPHHAFEEMNLETRRQVASKHRPIVQSQHYSQVVIKNQHELNEKYDNVQVQDFNSGQDYNPRPPEPYMAPPYRGDHGVEDVDQDEPRQLYIPNKKLVHLDLKGKYCIFIECSRVYYLVL